MRMRPFWLFGVCVLEKCNKTKRILQYDYNLSRDLFRMNNSHLCDTKMYD